MLLLLSCFTCVRLCATPETQPTRLPCSWDSPGKNTGVGCHFLLQCMTVKSESEAPQLCPTLSDLRDCTAHQAPLSMGFSRPEYWRGLPLPSPQLYIEEVVPPGKEAGAFTFLRIASWVC